MYLAYTKDLKNAILNGEMILLIAFLVDFFYVQENVYVA